MNLSCPLCADEFCESFFVKNDPPFLSQKVLRYYNCKNCHLVFQDTNSRLTLLEEKARYETHNNDPADTRYLNYLNPTWNLGLRATLAHYKKNEIKVLDYGCGAGRPLEVFCKKEGVYGAHYDPIYSPQASIFKAKYSLIFCIETCEHFYEPLIEFKKLAELMLDGGMLVIRTGVLSGLEMFPDWWYHRDPTHVCFFQKETFEYLADHLNLTLEFPEKNTVIFRKTKV